MTKIITTTTNSIEGWEIKEYLHPISANAVIGANVLSDFAASFTDFFGGRSGSYERRLNEIYDHAVQSLMGKAKALGCNAIVGLKVDFGEVSGKGTQMFMVSAVGTPVRACKRGDETIQHEDDFTIYDGELIERKIRARKIINNFSDNKYSVLRLEQSSIDFIVNSGLPEFANLVLSLLSNRPSDGSGLIKLESLEKYFQNIERGEAISVLYEYIATNEIDSHTSASFMRITSSYELIDYSKIKQLLESKHLTSRKFALMLLKRGKTSYDNNDVELLKEFSENINDYFPSTATMDQVKGMFSSTSKDVWVCRCGTKNSIETTHCSRCGADEFGFFASEIKPKQVIATIKNRLHVVGSLHNNF